MALHLDTKVVILEYDYGRILRIFDKTGTNDGTNFQDGLSVPFIPSENPSWKFEQVDITISTGVISDTLTITGSNLQNFLDPTIGYNINILQLFGGSYDRFEDGIYTFTVKYSGSEVCGSVENWESYDETYEAFLWYLWGKVRTLTIGVEMPIDNYTEVLSVSVVNLLMNSIVYLCKYGDIEKAEKTRKSLTKLVNNNSSLTEIFKNIKSYD